MWIPICIFSLPIIIIFSYWHPNYSDSFLTSKYFINHGVGYYEIVSLGKEKGYLRGDTIYDIRGLFVKKTGCKTLFPSEEYIDISSGITEEGAHLLSQDGLGYKYLYDFDRDSVLCDFLVVQFNDYIGDSFSDELQQRLRSVGLEFPRMPIPPHKEDFGKEYTKYNQAKKNYRQQIDSLYTTTIEKFIFENQADIFFYSDEFFFKKEGLIFKLISSSNSKIVPEINLGNLFTEYIIDRNIEHPLVYIQKTGSAIKKPYISWKFFPMWDGWLYTYFYKLTCDGRGFNFRGDYDNDYIVVDYEATDEKIYFALSTGGKSVNIYEYKR